jgi:phospholipid transport system transporter-binding protein
VTETCTTAPPTGGFTADDGGWRFDGALTLENAATVLEASQALPFPASGRIDLAGLRQADSAALAVIMALRRRARTEGRSLVLTGMPPGITSLADVYGVEDLARGVA